MNPVLERPGYHPALQHPIVSRRRDGRPRFQFVSPPPRFLSARLPDGQTARPNECSFPIHHSAVRIHHFDKSPVALGPS